MASVVRYCTFMVAHSTARSIRHIGSLLPNWLRTLLLVLIPIYPLIPRPTATADKLTAGFVDICLLSSHPITAIAGDSAGATLALATAQRLRNKHPSLADRLRSLVLISPVLDCGLDHPEVLRVEKDDPCLGIAGLQSLTAKLAGGFDIKDPLVSPLFGDIKGLPPVLLLSGTLDLLNADARRFKSRFQGKSVDEATPGGADIEGLTYVEAKDMIHVYPLLPHTEGAEARELIASFIKRQEEL
jgi:acetyl esterase/lipase